MIFPGSWHESRKTVAVFTCLLGLCWSAGLCGQETAPAQSAQTASEQDPTETPTRDISVRSREALSDLDRLRAEIDELGDPDWASGEVAQLREKVAELLPEGQTLEDLNPAAIDGVLVRSRALKAQWASLIDRLTDAAEQLETRLTEMREMRVRWQAIGDEAPDLPGALTERIQRILADTDELEAVVSERFNQVIELQNAAMEVRDVITPIEQRIDSYGRTRHTRLFEQNTAPIWSLRTEHISQSSEQTTQRLTSSMRRDFVAWVETSEVAIGAHFLLLPLLSVLFFRLRSAATEPPTGVLARPFPASVLVWMLLGIAIYVTAPGAVRMAYGVAAMLVAGVVLLQFVPKSTRNGVLVFIALAVLERVFDAQPVTEHTPRLAYLLVGIVLVVLSVLGLGRGTMTTFVNWGAPKSFVHGSVYAAATIVALSIVANVVGYVHLSKLLLAGVMDSVASFLVLFAGLTSISEVIEAGLSLKALDNFRSIANNRYRLRRVLRRPLVWLALFCWAWLTARGFGIDQWLRDVVQGVFVAETTIGEVTLSLRGVVFFVLAVWLAVWTSRIVRAVLNQDVLPRMDLPRGVPNTIAMTVHYSIILIGLLLGVGFMGIDLSSLAFVVGALGVGIGFGLQNVVNNFVSGLILIFEAPIQVGDTVEVGNLMGRVVQIGIRTSRVRTYGGSEVIVPNGELVSNQVINWTMSDRQRRLELNVGVAYGTDPEKVTDVLRGVVAADEEVLDDPEPLILFSEFGDSALNFRVLVWIGDFDAGFTTTHRLNTAINRALKEAGITVPFPQRDLHLKSVPEDLLAGGPGPAAI